MISSHRVSCFICMTTTLLFLVSFIQFRTSCLLVADAANTFSSSASFNNNIFMQYPTYVDTGPIEDAHVTSNNSNRRMICKHRPTDFIQQPRPPQHQYTVCLQRRKIGQNGNGIEPHRLGHVQSGAIGGAGGDFETSVVVHSKRYLLPRQKWNLLR